MASPDVRVPDPGFPRETSRAPQRLAVIALALVVAGIAITIAGMHRDDSGVFYALLTACSGGALVCGIIAIATSSRSRRKALALAAGIVSVVGACVGWGLGMFLIAVTHIMQWGGGGFGLGGAWGRPLRIRGKQLHPALTEGADWTFGARPDPGALDGPTRRALEALWLHDAQKEHASVPAFARVSWLLAAAGGPAELLSWSHRAAIEEIAHAQACFALAAGYGGRTFTVEPMPELLLGGLDGRVDPRITLAIESLADGCQLEDFNADVAAACAEVCEEPVTRGVLERIAREERGHAELSWAVVGWLVERHREVVAAALETAARELEAYPRPTAVGDDKRELVAAACEAALRRHGRLPDSRWAAIWDARKALTRRRLAGLLRSARGLARAA